MASAPRTSLVGKGIVGGLVSGSGPDSVAAPSGPSKTSQIGFGLVGLLVLGLGGGGAAPAPPAGTTGGTIASAAQSGTAEVVVTSNARVTQEVLEAVVELQPTVRTTQEVLEVVVFSGTVGDTAASALQSGTAGVAPTYARVTQEVVEAVILPNPNVRVTQEAVEVVLSGEPPVGWTVATSPRVRWDGTAERPWDALGEWKVRCGPHIIWGARVTQPAAQWRVRPKPRVIWRTGPGTASTECISADGVMPEPEPPVPTGEQNYVF